MKKRWYLSMGLSLMAITLLAQRLPAVAQDMFLKTVPNTVFKNFQDQIPTIDWVSPLENDDFKAYLAFYQLDLLPVHHYAGFQRFNHTDIFVHALVPEKAKATVMVLHGYFVHSGLLRFLIQALLKDNYAVLTLDLPGHGLSGGAKASIDDFSEYSEMINQISQSAAPYLPEYDAIIGHSTGAAGAWEYLLRYPEQPFKRAILAAPLVRSYAWELSQFSMFLGQSWLSDFPRILRPTSKDPDFLSFVRQDPLQYDKSPVSWVQALTKWNQQNISKYQSSEIPLLLIQGQQDTVVDWQYNIPFLEARFPNYSLKWLKESRHDIFWETEAIRIETFQAIHDFLARPIDKQ